MNNLTRKNKIFLVVGLSIVVFILITAYFVFRSKSDFANKLEQGSDNQAVTKTEVPKNYFLTLEEKTYDQLTEEEKLVTGGSPHVYQQDLQENLQVQIEKINPEPVNHTVEFSLAGFAPASVEVKRGDFVTFVNKTDTELYIVGENSWGNNLPLNKDEMFTQQFDIAGTYNYTIKDNATVKGVITVIK